MSFSTENESLGTITLFVTSITVAIMSIVLMFIFGFENHKLRLNPESPQDKLISSSINVMPHHPNSPTCDLGTPWLVQSTTLTFAAYYDNTYEVIIWILIL